METGFIETPEVNLYYTMRGQGPTLLVLQGGAGNAEGSEALANALADRFTVVTYDRRGLSRSKPKQGEGCEIGTHAADAVQLIDALSREPVFAFGSSIGALIGLSLVAAHPERIRLLVAHEPPAYRLLQGDEQEEALRTHRELHETFQRDGLPAALKLMIARSGVNIADREPEVSLGQPTDPQTATQRAADLEYFFRWDVPAVSRHQPDCAALIAAMPRIVPAVGAGSGPTRPYRCAIAWLSCWTCQRSSFREATPGMSFVPRLLTPNSTNCSRLNEGS